MTLTETTQLLGDVGDFVAAIAVVVTLLYLARQVRMGRDATEESTRATRAASAAQSQDALANLNQLLSTDLDLSKLVTTALSQGSLDGLAPDEQFRFQMAMRANMQHFESMFFRYEQEILEPRIWKLRRTYIGSLIQTPPVSDWWLAERASSSFTPEFIAEIESENGFEMGPLGQIRAVE